ncbi:hypothetical protein EHP00_2291 [Ecytonucleospora hepatopenaei]|uniref:Uncharacterized protein n=1 Tax=Ecytonucleospora hepatopenaei TaxID=646526 RepID=A0A1W0E3L8_9MICR|nr:hypothetical protein EHP00_2291 [Ecytonucleospora hepatopenaei]
MNTCKEFTHSYYIHFGPRKDMCFTATHTMKYMCQAREDEYSTPEYISPSEALSIIQQKTFFREEI